MKKTYVNPLVVLLATENCDLFTISGVGESVDWNDVEEVGL